MNEQTLQQIVESDRPRTERERMVKRINLLAPIVVTAALLGAVWLVDGFAMVRTIVGYGLVTFFALGKFLILKGITDATFGPFEFAFLVFYMDLAVAYLLTFNLDYVYGMPYFGKRLEGLQDHGRKVVRERAWVRKLTYLGVVLFVMIPATGTGAVGGSLFGRLLGLSRLKTFSGIFVGSALGCFGTAALAKVLAKALPPEVRESVWIEVIGVGFVVILIGILWLRARRIAPDGDGGSHEEDDPARDVDAPPAAARSPRAGE